MPSCSGSHSSGRAAHWIASSPIIALAFSFALGAYAIAQHQTQ
jgi:hypothetical protein